MTLGLRALARFFIAILLTLSAVRGAIPRDFAVDLKATVSTTSPCVVLSWTQRVQSNISAQKIHRRLKGETAWVLQATLTTTQTSYSDATAQPGVEYEYWMERTFTGLTPSTAMGYISAGVEVPFTESRGTILLVIDDTMVAPLAGEIAQLQRDMVSDGWTVQMISAPRSGTAISTKALIKAAYDADPTNVKAVYLLGHVPVPYSGQIAPDGHGDHVGAWPADGYYGEMNGTWTDTSVNSTSASRTQNVNIPGDGKFDQSSLPSALELMVGRVDLRNMTRAPVAAVSELMLLRRYLRKAHEFRHKLGAYASIPRRTLIRDGFGHAFSSEPFAVTAWSQAFTSVADSPAAPVIDEAPSGQWFFPNYAGGKTYLVGHGCGGGSYESASSVGVTAEWGRKPSKVVFTTLFGSYHGDWDADNCFLRAPLAGNATGDSLGLVCFWAGRPNWFMHHMGMGETVGYSARFSQNAIFIPGTAPGGSSVSGVHTGLMGDPTLRLHMVEPPRGLALRNVGGTVSLQWSASTEPGVEGYHVYRGQSEAGPLTRLTTFSQGATTYDDPVGATAGSTYVYVVRAVKLEAVPGGSYYNLSEGTMATLSPTAGNTGAGPMAPGNVAVTQNSGVNALVTWADNSSDETAFRVERKTDTGAFSTVATVGANVTSATDASPFVHGSVYYYRVVAIGSGDDSTPSAEASFDALAGYFEMSTTRQKVNKNAGTATHTVTRFGGVTGAVKVTCATGNSSAIAGMHFVFTEKVLTWADGETGPKTFTVPIINNAAPQLPRQFKVILNAPTGGAAIGQWSSMVTLIEDSTATLAAPWSQAMLGSITDSSKAVSAEGTLGDATIGGSGVSAGATSEAGRFVYQSRAGDGSMTIYVPTPPPAQSGARFALMVRDAATNTSAMAAAVTSGDATGFGAKLAWRALASDAALVLPSANNNHATPCWLRLTRSGNSFTAESSPDGTNWTTLGVATVTMPGTALWGVFHYSSDVATGTTFLGDFQLQGFYVTNIGGVPAPALPGSFALTVPSATSVNLTWNTAAYAAGYRIERRTETTGFTQIANLTSGATASYNDTTAAGDSAYEYRIMAYNASGNSAWSSVLRAITVPADVVVNLTADGTGNGDTTIRYASPTAAFGSDTLLTVAGSDVNTSALTPIAKSYLRFDLTGLPALKSATLNLAFVAARDITTSFYYSQLQLLSETSDTWNEATVTWNDAPQNATASQGLQGTYYSLGTWYVQDSTFLPATGTIVPFNLSVANLNTNKGANGLITVAFVPYQSSNVGAVDFASREHATLPPPTLTATYTPAAATRPSFLTATPGTGANVVLQWADNSSNESGFEIERRVINGTFALLQSVAADTTTFTDSTSLAGVTYEYRVRAIAAVGNSSWTPIATVTTASAAGAAAAATGSGLSGLTKYALGLDAASTGSGGRLSYGKVSVSGSDYLTFTYVRPEPAPAGVTYIVEASGNLTDWSASGIVPVSSTVSGGLCTVVVRDGTALTAGSQRFVRLRVTMP